jgi:PTH1 family peptidyl-tRNA hydrolase
MKLIVGLGNPGSKYKNVRHNLGFDILDYFSSQFNFKFDKNKFDGVYGITTINGEKIIFAKPMTYMNLSGNFVQKISHFYKIKPEDILIFADDKDIKLGQYKIRFSGSSAGQNGIKDIMVMLSTPDFGRVRVGIDSGNIKDTTKFVLGKLTKEERKVIESEFKIFEEVVLYFSNNTNLNLMNKFNG